MKKALSNKHRGYSLLDILLGMAIFSLGATGFILVLSQSFETARASSESLEANQLLVESMEAIKSIRNETFNTFTDGVHGLDDSSGTWVLTDEADIIGKFTRTVTVSSVYRDENFDIVEEGGTLDTRAKQITVDVTWNITPVREGNLSNTTYITKTEFNEWKLTTTKDFLLGTFDQTVAQGTGDGGEVTLNKTSEEKEWVLTGGKQLIETTDEDFGDGEQILTEVVGIGDDAYVSIDQTPGWHLASTEVGNELYAIELFNPYTGWVVGAQGTILYFNGVVWDEIQSPVTNHLMAIDGISPDDIWAAGKGGQIIHYDGTSWSEVTNPNSNDYYGVKMLASDDVWFVGSTSNDLLHWNGTGWETHGSTNRLLNAIDGIASDDVWAVGNNGKILYWDGSTWKNIASPTNSHINSIHAVASDDVWAVGDGGTIIHWDGTSWSEVTSPTTVHLFGLEGNSADNIWAVGAGGENLRYDGSTWTVLDVPSDRSLNDIDMFSNGNVMTVGNSGRVYVYIESVKSGYYLSSVLTAESDWISFTWSEDTPGNSSIYVSYRTGPTATPDDSWSAWSEPTMDNIGSQIDSTDPYLQYRASFLAADDETPPKLLDITFNNGTFTIENLNAVAQWDENTAIAIGNNGLAIWFDGTEWTENNPTTNQALHDITILAPDNLYVVGDTGTILHYTTAWAAESSPTSQPLYGIYAVDDSNIWAVGDNGTIIHYDGIGWNSVSSPTANHLYSITGTSAEDIWAAGVGGVTIHYDGTSWSTIDNPTSLAIYTIESISDGHVWAAGQGGMMMQYLIDTWSAYSSPTTDPIRELSFDTPGTGIAVGDNGTLLEYTSGTWANLTSPTTDNLRGVIQLSSNIGFAVGESGRLIKANGVDYTYFPSGTYTSNVFDTAKTPAMWDYIYWNETIEPGTAISIQTRTGNTEIPDGTWSAWSTAYTTPDGELITSPVAQYIQVQIDFSTTDTTQTPHLEELIILYD